MIAGTCHGCGRPLELAQVVSRSYRKLRSGLAIGARAELVTRRCECGAILTKLGNVISLPLHTRGSA